MKVYVVVWCDRHTDDLVDRVYADEGQAIAYARKEAQDNMRGLAEISEHLTREMKRDGWVYFAQWTTEEDYVYVVPMDVHT